MATEIKTPILIVHRDVNAARGLAELLVARYDVYVTKVPQRAIDFLQERQVDALIVSEHLEGTSALQWLPQVVASHPELVRIVLASGLCQQDTDAALASGLIHSCISEPIVATEFREIVDSFFLPASLEEAEDDHEEIALKDAVDDGVPEFGDAAEFGDIPEEMTGLEAVEGLGGSEPESDGEIVLGPEPALVPEEVANGAGQTGPTGEPVIDLQTAADQAAAAVGALQPQSPAGPGGAEEEPEEEASRTAARQVDEAGNDAYDEYRDLSLAETLSAHRRKLLSRQEKLTGEIEELKSRIGELEVNRREFGDRFERLQGQVDTLEKEIKTLLKRKQRLEEKRADMQRQVQEYEEGLARLVEKKVELETQCLALKDLQETMKAGIDPKTIRASIRPGEIYNKASQWAALWRKAEAKAERLELQIKKQEAQLRRLHEEVAKVRKRKELSEKSYREELRRYQEQLAALRRRAGEFEERCQHLVQQNRELTDKVKWLQAISERVGHDFIDGGP